MSKPLSEPLYGNCLIVAPDGQPLCRTNEKKIRWYVDRNLGEIIVQKPLTLRLAFEPQGRKGADDPYTISDKNNECVVCGNPKNITRHHVVPKCFRKFFPSEFKDHALYDVLILCIDCHKIYEIYAFEKKQRIAEKLNVSVHGSSLKSNGDFVNARAGAYVLLNFKEKIPLPRREELLARIKKYFGKDDITEEDMRAVVDSDGRYVPFGKVVVESLDSIENFIKEWREHFVETMQPRHLPAYWRIDHI